MASRSYFGKMNSTLGSVVPLAMFLVGSIWNDKRRYESTLQFDRILGDFRSSSRPPGSWERGAIGPPPPPEHHITTYFQELIIIIRRGICQMFYTSKIHPNLPIT